MKLDWLEQINHGKTVGPKPKQTRGKVLRAVVQELLLTKEALAVGVGVEARTLSNSQWSVFNMAKGFFNIRLGLRFKDDA